jgi:hypothetical protein
VGDFAATLRRRIDDAGRAVQAAQEAGHPYEVELHSAMLADLLRTAREHRIPIPGQEDRAPLSGADE